MSWVYELDSGKTALLCQGGFGASWECSSTHLSYTNPWQLKNCSLAPLAQLVSMAILNTLVWGLERRLEHSLEPMDMHITVSRNQNMCVGGALLPPFLFATML